MYELTQVMQQIITFLSYVTATYQSEIECKNSFLKVEIEKVEIVYCSTLCHCPILSGFFPLMIAVSDPTLNLFNDKTTDLLLITCQNIGA